MILQRVSSCIEKMGALLILEAMVDAIIKAKGFGYNFILLLSDSWRPVLVSNGNVDQTGRRRFWWRMDVV